MAGVRLKNFQKLSALTHFVISLIFAAIAYFASKLILNTTLGHFMFAWDVFCIVQVGISWLIFFFTTANETQKHANLEDDTRGGTFFLVMIATLGGLLAVFLLLTSKSESTESETLQSIISFVGMFLSWFLVHTVFTIRYAHLYYDEEHHQKHGGGLKFPDDSEPDFLDFAYYSLVLGMTFQVSDVSTTSKKMRRLTLLHSVLAFMFNTFIVALTINAVANIGG